MIDLTVKTLDSRNHSFSMPDNATVHQLKVKIEEVMTIPSNRQRLIFQGRVMQDDKKLSEYEVHGMVVHLVKSQPPQPGSRSSSNGSNNSNATGNSRPFNQLRYLRREDGNTLFGSVVIPVNSEAVGGRLLTRAGRLISNADHMLQRAVEVLDNYDNSPSRGGTSRSASAVASATTTPYNSSRDSSGSHSPTTEPSHLGRVSAESRLPSTSTTTTQSTLSTEAAGMDTEGESVGISSTPHITVSNADNTSASTSTATSGSTSGSIGTSLADGSAQDTNQQRQLQRSSTTAMSALLGKLRAVQNRFNPLLIRYHNLISEDPPNNNPSLLAERLLLTQTVPEVLHLLSHAYHSISDITIDWEQPPPRQMQFSLPPAIQLLQTEGMNPWGLTIPPNFTQPATASAATSNSTSSTSNASAAASTTNSTSATSASATGSVPEVTYMTTTFPAEGGEATTTFTTRPAADFETASAATGIPANGSATNRTPVVTASIDFTAARHPAFQGALNAAYAIANQFAALQTGRQLNQQPPQQQQASQQQQTAQQQSSQTQPQEQQQPQPQPTAPPLPGQSAPSIVTLPVGMIDIPANVEFFMEVGPSTITIDSVEAAMVTSGGFTPGTNGVATDGNPLHMNFPWGSTPPQEFLTSVVQALNRIITPTNPNLRRRGSAPESSQPNLQRRGSAPETESSETNAGNRSSQSTADSNSSNGPAAGSSPSSAPGQTSQARGYTATHPTTSTQTRSTARPHVHHISATQLPGYSGYTDPFLPCRSQFFATLHRYRLRTNNGAPMTANNSTQTSSNASPGTQMPNTTASQTGRSDNSTASSASLPGSTAAATQSSSQTPTQSRSSANAVQTTLLNFMQSLASAPVSDVLLNSVMGSLVAVSNQGNQTEVPIINLMFPQGDGGEEGESLLSDLRLAVVRSVTVSDLVALTGSTWDAVNHIRTDLKQFVVQRLCNGSPTEENLEQGVNLLMNELRPHFDVMLEGTLRDDVDAVATLNRFHESVVPEFFKLVLDDENSSNFGQNLHDMVHKYLSRLWAIIKRCCANNEAIDAIFQSCVNRMPQDVPLASVTARAYLNQLRHYTDGLNVPHEDIEPFLAYRSSANSMSAPIESAPSSSLECNADNAINETCQDETPPQKQTVEPMETDPLPGPQPTTSAGASFLGTSCQSLSSEEAVTPKSEETPVLPMDTEVPPVPAPEAWHRILPPEWVPIIARDTTRQRRPNTQAPLSDAYLAGMPPKRRKVVAANKPQGSLSEVISANMGSAIQSSGVPTAGSALVMEEASNDPRLREAYREQLRSTVRANLANNPDFSADRFPNAAQYFGKS